MRKLTLYSTGILAVAMLRAGMAFLPNIEPVLLFTLAVAIVSGPLAGFLFASSTILLSDLMIGLLGPWSLYTSISYGLAGLLAGILGMYKRDFSRSQLTLISVAMVLFYDLATSLAFSVNFMVPYPAAILNQIPFTAAHLTSCLLVFVLGPSLIWFTRKSIEDEKQLVLEDVK